MIGRTASRVKGVGGALKGGAVALALCDAMSALGGDLALASVLNPLANAGAAPEWVRLMPVGPIAAEDGREWVNDDAEAVVAASGGRDLVIDFDHATDRAAPRGAPAPAAGWIKELAIRDGAIWGRVEWTERGRAALAAREWRFLSPVFQFVGATKRVLRILRAGLTNDPAIGMPALAATDRSQEPAMTPELRKLLISIFRLDPNADEAAIQTAAAAFKSRGDTALATIAGAVGLGADEAPDAVAAAVADRIKNAKPDPAQYVPIAGFRELQERVAGLEKARGVETATAAVDRAIAAGKLTPALRDWGLELAAANMKAFEDFVGKAPTVVAGGRAVDGRPASGDRLSEVERAICQQLGLAEKDFLATRNADQKEAA